MNNNEITLRIAEAIKKYRKRSERVVGYVPYTLAFDVHKYQGVSRKLGQITVLQNAIVNLVNSGVNSSENIAQILGFDMAYDIEREYFNNSLNVLLDNSNLLESKRENLFLTQKGKDYIESGEYYKTFSRSFELYVDSDDSNFVFLKECVEDINDIEYIKKAYSRDRLTFAEVKNIAEQQASFVQHSENGLELQSADLISVSSAEVVVYVCFLQSIKDDSIRTLVYEATSDCVIELLSKLFDNNEVLRDGLLKNCLKNEVKNEDALQVDSGKKTETQIATEARILEEIDSKDENDIQEQTDIYQNKVGAVYDSTDFEHELHEIFEKHQNDEIWLISPWIKKYAFLRAREPMIRKFLDQGGAIFIGYSEPERVGEEMVDCNSMFMVKQLDSIYNKFYYVELPKFHMKNVIEQKGDITNMYTGSFNILSFCINGSEEHYRMEQMTFTNREEAVMHRKKYLEFVTNKYIEDCMQKITKSNDKAIDISKFEYLKKITNIDKAIASLKDAASKSNVKIVSNVHPDANGMLEIARKLIDSPYMSDLFYVQAKLAALLFIFEYAKSKKLMGELKKFESGFVPLIKRNSMYKICRFAMRKGRENPRKSIINIVCNGLNFEFGEIQLSQDTFNVVSKHKEWINFKEENIKNANRNINDILYNSAKSVGYTGLIEF